jgi:hypothetical protein
VKSSFPKHAMRQIQHFELLMPSDCILAVRIKPNFMPSGLVDPFFMNVMQYFALIWQYGQCILG